MTPGSPIPSDRRRRRSEECDDLMRILQAYRFALDPSPRRQRAMFAHLGARRFAYNWGLALVKARLDARARGDDVEVPYTLPALRRQWNQVKETAAPWWREHSKEAYSSDWTPSPEGCAPSSTAEGGGDEADALLSRFSERKAGGGSRSASPPGLSRSPTARTLSFPVWAA